MCEVFADYFSTVYGPPRSDQPTLIVCELKVNISTWHISAKKVENKLRDLDSLKSAGPDNISPAVLKIFSYAIAPHLSIYFYQLMSGESFPNVLKPGNSNILESLVLDGLSFSLTS